MPNQSAEIPTEYPVLKPSEQETYDRATGARLVGHITSPEVAALYASLRAKRIEGTTSVRDGQVWHLPETKTK